MACQKLICRVSVINTIMNEDSEILGLVARTGFRKQEKRVLETLSSRTNPQDSVRDPGKDTTVIGVKYVYIRDEIVS